MIERWNCKEKSIQQKSKINNKKNKEQIRKKIINEKLGLNDEIEDK